MLGGARHVAAAAVCRITADRDALPRAFELTLAATARARVADLPRSATRQACAAVRGVRLRVHTQATALREPCRTRTQSMKATHAAGARHVAIAAVLRVGIGVDATEATRRMIGSALRHARAGLAIRRSSSALCLARAARRWIAL